MRGIISIIEIVCLLAILIFASSSFSGVRTISLKLKRSGLITSSEKEGKWVVTKEWNKAGERQFSSWIARIGEAKASGRCGGLLWKCMMKIKINGVYPTEYDKSSLKRVMADCGRLPYILRAFFAYKTERPFSYAEGVRGKRYTSNNRPLWFKDFSQFRSFKEMVWKMNLRVRSGHYRMAAHVQGSDTYPVKVTRESITPGTVYYDYTGHILMVYKVEKNGVVRFIDGHPTKPFGSLTTATLSQAHAAPSKKLKKFGGGFRKWRHIKIEPIANSKKGKFYIIRSRNSDSPYFSNKDQYRSKFEYMGETLKYNEWVNLRLSLDGGIIYPVKQFAGRVDSLCQQLKDRATSVSKARRYYNKPLEIPPRNIYQAEGFWESYSTPSRDVRFRIAVKEIYENINNYLRLKSAGHSRLKYEHSLKNLVQTIYAVWNLKSTSCMISYKNGNDETISINLREAIHRIYDLSYNPYHCIELRWGAHPKMGKRRAHSEYKTCKAGSRTQKRDKRKSYVAESRYRNWVKRKTRYRKTYPGPRTQEEINITTLLNGLFYKYIL